MATTPEDIDLYVNSPDLLLGLLSEVIKALDAQRKSTELDEREKQLQEIAKTIDKLEQVNVSVPDELRKLKIGLVAELAIRDEANELMEELADGLDDALQNLNSLLGRNKNNGNFSAKDPKKRKLKQPRTPDEVLRAGIITVLKNMNGSGHIQQILAAMEQQLAGQLLEHDLENVASGKQLVWQNNVCWERNKMVKEGILKNDSLRGIWELTEAYR
ncbi:MAG: winged helix-turn-helix domain-containing protein [Methylococcales bacterium]|nr:winged helix-turn-helix domain-containing protein [Methylococcales bacterium]